MNTFTMMIAALASMLLTAPAYAQEQEEPVAAQTEEEPMASISRGPLPNQKQPEPEDMVWAEYLRIPDTDKLESRALSAPINQDGATILVIVPPKGFDSAALVVNQDDVGIYLIANISDDKEAMRRARELERQARAELNLEKVKSDAANAVSAATLVPQSEGQELKLVNVIVAKDMLTGNTVTLAFTY